MEVMENLPEESLMAEGPFRSSMLAPAIGLRVNFSVTVPVKDPSDCAKEVVPSRIRKKTKVFLVSNIWMGSKVTNMNAKSSMQAGRSAFLSSLML